MIFDLEMGSPLVLLETCGDSPGAPKAFTGFLNIHSYLFKRFREKQLCLLFYYVNLIYILTGIVYVGDFDCGIVCLRKKTW